ncbi:hypothetical protein QVD17_27563 [Tagetes erecta]|uniref:Retrotransposon Copia-like N-terminal domain-containing protein n=1 Tax=Tagetes erecta TaxID=13708 RepID=A0AAD8K8Q6_TARER|nr:hypothetical protein QVD17_27563 [Tagetes erecta]
MATLPLLSASERIQDFEYLYASNTNVFNFVSVKLSGASNYLLWKEQMLCLLDVDEAYTDSVSDHTMIRRYDNLARGWILGSVNEDVLGDVVCNLRSAKAVWEKLRSTCDPTVCLKQGQGAPLS